MTTTFDALRYQRTLECWRGLAERRLEHMTQLYETGRWRRYYSEEKFLSVIRETKAAADAWRRIAPQVAQTRQVLATQVLAERTLAERAPAAQVLAMPTEPAFVRTQPPPSPFAAIDRQRSVA